MEPTTTAQSRQASNAFSRNKTKSYNPSQSIDQRREIRKKYRELTRKTVESRQAFLSNADPGAKLIRKNFEQTNALYDQVENPQEAVQDSRLYVINTDIFHEKARRLKMGSAVELDTEEFLSRIALFVYDRRHNGDNERDDDDADEAMEFEDEDYNGWARLGDIGATVATRPAVHEFLAAHAEPKSRRAAGPRSTQQSQFTAAITRPQELTQSDLIRNDNGTNQSVIAVMEIIQQYEDAVGVFELIINPESFAQSVENMFNLSFLVRDQKVHIFEDENGDLLVRDAQLIDSETEEGRKLLEESLVPKQFIFELDLLSWKELIEAYRIQESLIPTRHSTTEITTAGNKSAWYG